MNEPDSASVPMPLATNGLRWIPAQTYTMGSDQHYPEEAPAHRVSVDGFWIEAHQVTNAQFQAFVDATGYVTVAEHHSTRLTFRARRRRTCNRGRWSSRVRPNR